MKYTVVVETLRRKGFTGTTTDTSSWFVAGNTFSEAMSTALDCAWRSNDFFESALKARVVSITAHYDASLETEPVDIYQPVFAD